VARWGFEVLKKATEIGRETDLPVYIHMVGMEDRLGSLRVLPARRPPP
jgi:hypothetical protein